MGNKEILIHDFNTNLICDYFGRLERQGPGSPESTLRALSFIDEFSNKIKIADFGCGTGGQTITLAQNTNGTIIGLDIYPDFIEKFNLNAKKYGLQNRVKGIIGSMDNLPFQNEEFDVIWSEGAIANIGFEKGLNYWRDFLKKDGYIAVTYESWFTDKRPAEIEKFWVDSVPEIATIKHNISIIQKSGYSLVAAFTLPDKCWTDTYFTPQQAIRKSFLEINTGNETAKAFVEYMKYEAELYTKYKQYYGYVFYIGKKLF
ncbi:MAG: class I SAM-dependent methyltransferase [Ignavibacteria bacterium]